MPRCKTCKDKFIPKYFNQKNCFNTHECIAAEVERKKKVKQKDWNREKKVRKEALKTRGEWFKDLQTEINKIARLIDRGHPCMMCDNNNMKRINGCHYHSVGSSPALRFNLINVWAGCHKCNVELGGNIPGFDIQLMDTYGRDFWESIKFNLVKDHPYLGLNISEVQDKIKIARVIVKELSKMDVILSNDNRIAFRKKYNKRLGIYDN